MNIKHTNDGSCPRCAQKLTETHPVMVSWFCWVKGLHPDVHIAWSFRDEANQNEMFGKGLSKLKWPESKHNHMENGFPCSKALDLFQLSEKGEALFQEELYELLNKETKEAVLPIRWGGTFKNFKDLDHFEVTEENKNG